MKLALALFALSVLPAISHAGDNGSYTKCVSKTGRTVLKIGQVDSGANPNTVELIIDGKTFGAAIIGSEVFETVSDGVTRYTEADHDAVNWVTFEQREISRREAQSGITRIKILSGLDPRSGKALDTQIELVCKTVFNPI